MSKRSADWLLSQRGESLTSCHLLSAPYLRRRRGGGGRGHPTLPSAFRPAGFPPTEGASHADGDVAAGARAAFDARAARPGLGLTAAQRAQQQPQVEDDAGPARRHLHPEGGPAAVGEGGLQHRRFVAAGGQQEVGSGQVLLNTSVKKNKPPGPRSFWMTPYNSNPHAVTVC